MATHLLLREGSVASSVKAYADGDLGWVSSWPWRLPSNVDKNIFIKFITDFEAQKRYEVQSIPRAIARLRLGTLLSLFGSWRGHLMSIEMRPSMRSLLHQIPLLCFLAFQFDLWLRVDLRS